MGGEYYERLGVPPDASTDEIAAAYREQLKQTHPDVSDANDAGERTKRLIEAKEVLTDETERTRYDRLGHERYLSVEQGRTPAAGSTTDDNRDPETRERPRTGGGDQTSSKESTNSTGTDHGGARQRQAGTRGTRGSGGVDWGTHTARQGRSRHRDGIDWEEWAETDWEAVSEAVWQEVTGEHSGGSGHTTAGRGTSTAGDDSPSDTRATGTAGPSGGDGTPGNSAATGSGGESDADTAERGERTAGSTTSRTAGRSRAADTGRRAAGAGTGRAETAAANTTAGATGAGTTASGRGSSAGTADRGDWTVGWYNGGDPSGTSHEAHSYGGSDTADDLWGGWSPGLDHDSRSRQGSFPPHRILSPMQSVVLLCICFVIYPLLVTGTVFEFFNPPTRLVLAMFLVFVVAILIILSQFGVVVFAGWTLLFPVSFVNYGVSVFAPAALLTMIAVVASLGLAVLSWLLIRPPTL